MAQITYISGPLKSGKTATAAREISDALKNNQQVAVILPSIDHLQFLKTEILHGQPAIAPGQLFLGTFFAWAERILDKTRRYFQTTDPAEEWLNIREILKNYPGYFTGHIQLLQGIFSDFRNSGLTQSGLEKLADHAENPAFSEWIEIYRRLRQIYWQNCAGPAGELLAIALERLQDQPECVSGDLLVIDGFYEFTPIQRDILNVLSSTFKRTICTVVADPTQPVYKYCRNQPGLFGPGELIHIPARVSENGWTEAFRGKLFSGEIRLSNQLRVISQTGWKNDWSAARVKIVQVPNRRSEIETAARAIKSWIRDGVAPEKIGVTYRGSFDYTRLVSLIFPDFGLPVVTPTKSLASSEPAQALNRIIQINLQNFTRPHLMDLLRLPALRQFYGANILQELEIYSAEWGLPAGKTDWLSRCQHRIAYLEFIRQNQSDEPEETEHYFARTQIERLRQIQPVLNRLLDDIILPKSAGWPEYQRFFTDILNRYYSDSEPQFSQPLSQINTILRRLGRLAGRCSPTSLSDLAEILNRFLVTATLKPTNCQSGIYCGDVMAIRGLEFDGLILLGMIDGEFPVNRAESPLFNNELRRSLNRQAGTILFPEGGPDLSEDKFLLYLLMTRVNERLLITYPELDSAGRALPVSPFVTDLLVCHSPESASGIMTWESIPAGQVIPDILTISSESDLLQVALAENPDSDLFRELTGLTDANGLEQVVSRRNDELARQTAPGVRNGVLPAGRVYPEFLKTPLSVTKIQNYIDCPFAYLCRNIWKIAVPSEPQIGPDALTAGLLIHKTFEQFVREFLQNGAANWPDFLNEADEVFLKKVLAKVDALFRRQLHFIPALLWEQMLDDLLNGLRRFVEVERLFSETGFVPAATENQLDLSAEFLRIGEGDQAVAVTLKGKIDRTDQNASNNRFLVIDYKRSAGNIQDIIRGVRTGSQFQIPLYLLMVAADKPAIKIGGAFYYSFNDGKRTRGFLVDSDFGRTPVLNESGLNELMEETRLRVGETLEQIYRGNFNLAPRNDSRCRAGKCEFYDMCRVEADSSA